MKETDLRRAPWYIKVGGIFVIASLVVALFAAYAGF